MNPKRALTRPPGRSYTECLSCHPLRNTVNLSLAKKQHAAYCLALRELGLEVITLEPDDSHPDACFVEDTAVVHGQRALVCRMGAESRRGEEGAVEDVLRDYFSVRRAATPATVEGGDVVHLENKLISGISQRTNKEGVTQMATWLEVDVDRVIDPEIMHLKSYVTYLGRNTAIASQRLSKHQALAGLSVIEVPDEEAYAADTLAVGDAVIMPAGMPKSEALVRKAGFEVVPFDVSEFEKCDGAVTCLSILFERGFR